MTFLHFGLLAGAAAVAVPLLIHLLSRRRPRPVAWGAMFLVDRVARRNRRRVKVERWLLLAIRCALPVLLALAMARPVFNGWRALVGDAPASAVIVLDASYSMSARGPDGSAADDAARAAAAEVLRTLPRGSEAAVLVAGGGVEMLGEGGGFADPAALGRAAAAVDFDRGPADLPQAVAAAESLLRDAAHRRRDVILVSDFRGATELRPSRPADDGAPELTLVRVGTGDAAATANVAVEGVRLAPALPGVGRPVRVLAALRNTGGVDLDGLTVRLDVDGVTRGEQRLAVAAGATREAEFATRFDAPGDHVLRVWLDAAAAGDAVPADDDFRLALDVPRTLPVLLVAGETARPFPENPADFLQLALDPAVASPAIELSSLLRPRVVSAAAFGGTSLDGARVVVLANVPRLGDAQTALLREFVENGGGLIVFPGDRCDPAYYDAELLFPARLGPARGGGDDGTARAGDPPYSYPPLLPWNDAGNGSLAEATIRRWFALVPKDFAESDNAAAAPEVVARLDTGEPMLVQRGVGRGVVVMAATSAAADWSDLPLRAAYLPLAQQLVTYAAARATPPRTVATGQPLVVPLAAPGAALAVVVAPDGRRREMTRQSAAGRSSAAFDQTLRPGLYRVERAAADAPADPILFAVNAPREESQSPAATADGVGRLAAAAGARLAAGADAYAALDHQRRFGREAWPGVWAAVLVLLFAELFVQRQRPARGGGHGRSP